MQLLQALDTSQALSQASSDRYGEFVTMNEARERASFGSAEPKRGPSRVVPHAHRLSSQIGGGALNAFKVPQTANPFELSTRTVVFCV